MVVMSRLYMIYVPIATPPESQIGFRGFTFISVVWLKREIDPAESGLAARPLRPACHACSGRPGPRYSAASTETHGLYATQVPPYLRRFGASNTSGLTHH